MKLFYILVVVMSLATASCSHKKTKKLIIHKMHIPTIKCKPKVMPLEKPKDDNGCWFNPCK